MDWVIYVFGSGAAFFVGVGLILVSLFVSATHRRASLQVVASLVAVVGLIFVALSATPLPYWLYAVAGIVTVPWLVAERSRRDWFQARRRKLRWAVAVTWLAAAAVEVPYHFPPSITATGQPRLYIVGDSIAAGVSDREDTWPRILASKHVIDVADFSHVGADVTSAMRQADRLPADGGLVLLEIGGNDLLGTTSTAEYENGLDRLLARVRAPDRTVVMFELPLPPFCNGYGLAQRRLAAKYGVPLIPKRILIAVLTGDAATLDSIHLTPAGHERLADAVWAIIGPLFGGDGSR
jgi:acyl-CoA thioesterase-1